MTIPSVVQGTVETEDGKVFELNSPKGSTWVKSVNSFRYESVGANKPYTVRKESGKGGDYWYGYRKVAGKLHKRYIGKSSELSTAKLEEIAEALNTPPQPRVTDKVTNKVTDRAAKVTETNTHKVTDTRDADRLTALELQVEALQEYLQESLKALWEVLPGKLSLSDSPELLKPNAEVTDSELQIEIGNLEVENEKLKADYTKLLESSTVITNKLRQELAEVRSQLEAERADREEVEVELKEAVTQVKDAQRTIVVQRGKIHDLERGYGHKPTPTEGILRRQLGELQAELSYLKQKLGSISDFPEAADLLNQLKGRRKKSRADLADMEAVLDVLVELGI